MTKTMSCHQLVSVARNVVKRLRSKEFYVRIDLSDVECLDHAYGDGAAHHADLLMHRALRKFCGEHARLVQDGPLEYVAIVLATDEAEAVAFAECVQDEFKTLLFDAGYECGIRQVEALV